MVSNKQTHCMDKECQGTNVLDEFIWLSPSMVAFYTCMHTGHWATN